MRAAAEEGGRAAVARGVLVAAVRVQMEEPEAMVRIMRVVVAAVVHTVAMVVRALSLSAMRTRLLRRVR